MRFVPGLLVALALCACGKSPCVPTGSWSVFGVRNRVESGDAGTCVQQVSGTLQFKDDKNAQLDLDTGLSTSCSVSADEGSGKDGGTQCYLVLQCPPCGKNTATCNLFDFNSGYAAPAQGAVIQGFFSDLRTDSCTEGLTTSIADNGGSR